MAKVLSRQCPSSALAPAQSAPRGSGQRSTPRKLAAFIAAECTAFDLSGAPTVHGRSPSRPLLEAIDQV
eukprot:scaffold10872_cov52-Phaeocystis_antarctica.AAC.1